MPIQRCTISGKRGYRWGTHGKCYRHRTDAIKQMKAILATGWKEPVSNARKIMRADPTRTTLLRRSFVASLTRRFKTLSKRVTALLVTEDAFGLNRPAYNTRFMFMTSPDKVLAFNRWLATQIQYHILGVSQEQIEEAWWMQYIQEGYKKGAGRAFDDVRKPLLSEAEKLPFYNGTKAEFLRSSFAQPVAVEKVKLLASRTFTELKGVTDEMATKLTRTLTDGLVQGQNPKVVAKTMATTIEGISTKRAATIARTEIIRCHAEAQLDAMQALGVDQIGVMVEWATAEDERVCDACADLENIVLSIDEARGMLPRHPNCRCAYIPANVGEDEEDQIRPASRIQAAITRSVKTAPTTTWVGQDAQISKTRPESSFS